LVKRSAWRIEFVQRKKETVNVHGSKYFILMIDAKCLVVYWQPKGHDTATIYEKHVTWFHEKALAYPSVTNWLRRLHFGEN
jgi:hypothetical protein